jgi:cysteine desulfurase
MFASGVNDAPVSILLFTKGLRGEALQPRIYLDNSATTRVDERVLESMLPCLRDDFGNPSSIHTFGQEARALVVVFTSGGTESDNAALRGVFRSRYRPGNHIITSKIEHPAVLATCKALESEGAEITYIPVDSSGCVDPAAVAAAIKETTVLISIMHANNETGMVQPVEEIAALARERGIIVHTDAVQSVGKIPIDMRKMGVDLLSLSAHKIHGPKGIGALYVRKGINPAPFMTGGSQERRRRAGTENVPGIAGLGEAARLACERTPEMGARIAGLRDKLENLAFERIKGVRVNGRGVRLPNVTNLSFDGLEGESAVIALDLEGVAVSTGSACSSGSLEPSHVLIAMGLRPEVIRSSIRFSLCYHNTKDEIERASAVLAGVAERLRKFSRGARD